MSTFMECLPDDLLLAIFGFCDIDTLLDVSLTCRRFYTCIDRESFWKEKLQDLYGKYEIPYKVKPKSGYKAACLRFAAVFDTTILQTDCSRCQDIFCVVSCIQDRDEVIIFDFGSKTTWFKYASDSTGQLSMHPTVCPLEQGNVNPLSQSADDSRDIYNCCPVCSRMFHNRSSALPEPVVIPKVVRSHHGSRRLTAAFSRLAWRHFPLCFDSSELGEDDCLSLGMTEPQACVSPSVESENHVEEKTNEVASEDIPADDRDGENVEAALSVDPEELECETYKFLTMHMLKRNPCFQAKCIPFVLCEPTNCSLNMKVQLLQFLFTEVRVPGVCYIPKPVATSLYSGVDTCLVIDSGANNTVISGVVDQNLLSHCVQRKPIGGMFLTKRLLDCIKLKVEFEVDEANIDSSQVKRECYLAYNIDAENRKSRPPKNIHVKGFRNHHLEYQPVALGPELYLAAEDLYLNMDLPAMIADLLRTLDAPTAKKLINNIVLTGGNCRLNGLSLRLTKDLQQVFPEYSASIRVLDPRLMTGRTDAVIGASYIRKWYDAHWTSRQDYIYHGAAGCLEKALAQQVHCV